MANMAIPVAGPQLMPRSFGLLSVLTFRESADNRWIGGITQPITLPGEGSVKVTDSKDLCDLAYPAAPASPDVCDYALSLPMIVTTKYSAPLTSGTQAEIEQKAYDSFAISEEETLVGALLTQSAAPADTLTDGTPVFQWGLDDSTEVHTSTDEPNLEVLLGVMEQRGFAQVGGLGVLWVDFRTALLLMRKGLIETRVGGRLYTKFGTPVVVHGDPNVASGDQDTAPVIRMSGPLTAYRGYPYIVGSFEGSIDFSNNKVDLYIAREYLITAAPWDVLSHSLDTSLLTA